MRAVPSALQPPLEKLQNPLVPADPVRNTRLLGFQLILVLQIPFVRSNQSILVGEIRFPAKFLLDLLGRNIGVLSQLREF